MSMQTNDGGLTVAQMATKPLDLISMDIRRRHFNCGRQIQNNLVLTCRPPHVDNGFTDVEGKLKFGGGETFR